MVVIDSTPIEVATFRSDGPYLDGRHPSRVSYSNLKEDALRRDFTVNALFFDVSKNRVIDEVGGISDLQKGFIRAVGQPAQRFQEDHLRILRAIRFASQLNFAIENATLKAVEEFAPLLKMVSPERIFNELQRMFSSLHMDVGLYLARRSGVLNVIAPNLTWPRWEFTMRTVQSLAGRVPASVAFAVCLYGNSASAVDEFLDSLKVSANFRSDVKNVHQFLEEVAGQSIRAGELIYSLGQPLGPYLLVAAEVYYSGGSHWQKVEKAWAQLVKVMTKKGELPAPILRGEDLLQLGIQRGPIFGEILHEIYLQQLESKIENREAAMNVARSLAKL